MSPQHLDPTRTQQKLTEHPYYRYRGCAPDVDQPSRAAGNLDLAVDAWQGPDLDGGEDQDIRVAREAAAKAVCGHCPVLAECRAFGASVVVDGDVVKLADPFSILGAMTALERIRAFIKTRHEVAVPAPDRMLRTAQKLAVLRALAQFADPYEVADAAGMDVRKANWHRSKIATMLNLPVGATRGDMLAEAGRRGLLDGVAVVEDDGSVLAVPPATRMPYVPSPVSVALFADDVPLGPAPAGSARAGAGSSRASVLPAAPDGAPYEPVRVPAPRRARFAAVTGQLEFDDLFLDDLASTPVSALPVHAVLLEAA